MPKGVETPPEIVDFIIDEYVLNQSLKYPQIAGLVEGRFGYHIDKTTVGGLLRKAGLSGTSDLRLVEIGKPHGDPSGGVKVLHLLVIPRINAPQAEIEIKWSAENGTSETNFGSFNVCWTGGDHLRDLLRDGEYSFPVAIKIEGEAGFRPICRGFTEKPQYLQTPLTQDGCLVRATVYGPRKHYGSRSFRLINAGPGLADLRMAPVA